MRTKNLSNQERLQLILNSAQEGIWELNAENKTIFANQSLLSLLGYSLDEVLGKSVFEFMLPEDAENTKLEFSELLDDKRTSHEFTFIKSNHENLWLRVSCLSLTDESEKKSSLLFCSNVSQFRDRQCTLESLQKLANIGCWELDTKTGLSHWSDQVYQIHGLNSGTSTNMIMGVEFYAPHERERIMTCVQRCIEGRPFRETFELFDSKKERKWVEVTGQPIRDNSGHVYKLRGSIQDITEKKLAELAIQEQEARIHALFSQTTDAIMTITPPSWNFTSCNPAALSLFEVATKEEFLRLGPSDLSPTLQSDGTESSVKVPQMIQIAMSRGQHQFHWEHRTRTGKIISCSILLSRIDVGGESYLQASVRNISKEKIAQDKLHTLSKELSMFFDVSVGLLGIAGIDGKFKRINPSFSKLLGFSMHELLSKPFFEFLHPDDVEPTKTEIQRLSMGELTVNYVTRCRCSDGSYKLLSWTAAPDLSTNLLYVGARDITAEVNKQKELEQVMSGIAQSAIVSATDASGRIIEVNDLFCKVSGYSRDELIGQNHHIVNSGIHPRSFFKNMWRTISEGVIWEGDLQNRAKDGSLFFVRTVITPIRNHSGEIEKFLSVSTDLTTEVQYKQQLENAQALAKVGRFEFNLKTQDLQWSKELYEYYGVPLDVTGPKLYHAFIDRIHPDDRVRVLGIIEGAVRTGQDYKVNFRLLRPDGQIRYMIGLGQIMKNQSDETAKLIGTYQDASELFEREIRIKELADLMRAIYRSATFSIITTDLTGTITSFNAESERLSGYRSEDVVGKHTPALFYDPKEVELAAKELSQEYRTSVNPNLEAFVFKPKLGLPDERQWSLIHKDGSRVQVKLSITGLHDQDGTLYGFLGIGKDLTHDLEIQRALELEKARSLHNAKLASLGEMSAGIAHEINNPLAIIVGNVPLLRKYKDDETKFEAKMDAISKASSRIDRIVRGLRKFARSSDESVFQPHLIKDIVSEALVIAEAKSKRHGTPIEVLNTNTAEIFCDSVEMEQVLVNLINNAIDAVKDLEERWVRLKIFDEGEEVVLQVIDSGPGIPPEIEQKLFQPFFTTKTVGEGTGLGLSISKGILDQHRAQFMLNHASPNTCFEVRIPMLNESRKIA